MFPALFFFFVLDFFFFFFFDSLFSRVCCRRRRCLYPFVLVRKTDTGELRAAARTSLRGFQQSSLLLLLLLVPGTWFAGVHIFNAEVGVHSKRCSLVLVVVFLLVNSVTRHRP